MTNPTPRTTEEALEAVKTLRHAWEAATHRATDQPGTKPTALPLKNIKAEPAVFQHRTIMVGFDEDGYADHDRGHAAQLTQALIDKKGTGAQFVAQQRRARAHSQPFDTDLLDPVLIFGVGDDWFLIDGFHRREAYLKWAGSDELVVPVEVFEGTFDNAIAVALSANMKAKLPMSSSERAEAAWKMVLWAGLGIVPKQSKAETSRQSGMSPRSVANMQRFLKSNEERIREAIEAGDIIRWATNWKYTGDTRPTTEDDMDERRRRWVDQASRKLGSAFKDTLMRTDGDWFLDAVQVYSPTFYDNVLRRAAERAEGTGGSVEDEFDDF